ncbi:DUF3533 domain-containing protein, partial [Streptomyces sp. ND04-05B]|nr:DUF3533 domain-containing protein [Streptomyces sp. ND04-05B]
IAYFEGNDTTGPLLVLSAWAAAGAAITVVMAALRRRPTDPPAADRPVG